MAISRHFSTLLYSARHPSRQQQTQLLAEISDIMKLDRAGIAWSRKNYPNGFTSYASANELHRSSTTFQHLERWIDKHIARFAAALNLELNGGRLKMTNCWANVMRKNSHHGLHLHPLSVLSGTFYVSMPAAASAIKFEDPRLPLLMHSPARKPRPRQGNRLFLEVPAKAGTLLLFESWLRHEVPLQKAAQPRVSISFNYDWE